MVSIATPGLITSQHKLFIGFAYNPNLVTAKQAMQLTYSLEYNNSYSLVFADWTCGTQTPQTPRSAIRAGDSSVR